MSEPPTTPDPLASRQATESEQSRTLRTETAPARGPVSEGSRVEVLRGRGTGAVARIKRGAPGQYWSHLTGVDFMNSSFAFAALAVVSALPFLAVVSAATGAGGVRRAIITRIGLNAPASRDVEGLIVSGREVSTLTAFSAVLLVSEPLGWQRLCSRGTRRSTTSLPRRSSRLRRRTAWDGALTSDSSPSCQASLSCTPARPRRL